MAWNPGGGMGGPGKAGALGGGMVGGARGPMGGFANRSAGWQGKPSHGVFSASEKFKNRSRMWDVGDWLAGPFMDVNQPTFQQPKSWTGGDWHTSSNPGGLLGGLAGMAFPGAGLLGAPIGSAIWNKAGLPQMWHGQGAQAPAGPGSGPGSGTGTGGGLGLRGGRLGRRGGRFGPGGPGKPGGSPSGGVGAAFKHFPGLLFGNK